MNIKNDYITTLTPQETREMRCLNIRDTLIDTGKELKRRLENNEECEQLLERFFQLTSELEDIIAKDEVFKND